MEPTLEQIRNMNRGKKLELAQKSNTPTSALKILSKDKHWDVREAVAKNLNTPIELLKELSKDKSWGVKWYVAGNHNTPVDVLKELATDDDWRLRISVVYNPNSTEQILVSVFEYERSHRKRKEILEAIITNSNCPRYLKATIQTMFPEWVRR
jgi:pyridoxal biosynthesis lyase PdxS